jgi:hypothetical protein
MNSTPLTGPVTATTFRDIAERARLSSTSGLSRGSARRT